jgi:hypothetical protein
MWTAFRALAARIGLSSKQVMDVERAGGGSLVQHPLNPDMYIKVLPDPDWSQRLGEAWNGTLINSRRQTVGTIPIPNGLLSIAEAYTPDNETVAEVVPGQYEVTLVVAWQGAEETDDYEEQVSHAFALLQGKRNVASIVLLTNENGVELGVDAHAVAFSSTGALKKIAGDHLGRWTLKLSASIPSRWADGNKSIRLETDVDSGAAIIFNGGHGRDDYPLWKLADVDGNTIGVMADFFVDNRP